MRDLVSVFKGLADPTRLRIIKLLEKKKMCVCELTAVL
ncbi:winged helix-turn-helix transcriptional regulator, partial [candidate division WOR-3 bacterium]|nr:winged helix-turn-helix transcriptional regulator [candidate division WOR-3 bacterium]